MIDWLPIDTAPKDGTDIIVYYEFATVPIIHIAYWDSDEQDQWEYQKFRSKDEKIGWWSYVENSISQHKLVDFNSPTHWVPYNKPTN